MKENTIVGYYCEDLKIISCMTLGKMCKLYQNLMHSELLWCKSYLDKYYYQEIIFILSFLEKKNTYLQTDSNELHFKQQLNSVLQILTPNSHGLSALKVPMVQSSKVIPSKSPPWPNLPCISPVWRMPLVHAKQVPFRGNRTWTSTPHTHLYVGYCSPWRGH